MGHGFNLCHLKLVRLIDSVSLKQKIGKKFELFLSPRITTGSHGLEQRMYEMYCKV